MVGGNTEFPTRFRRESSQPPKTQASRSLKEACEWGKRKCNCGKSRISLINAPVVFKVCLISGRAREKKKKVDQQKS